MRTASSYNQSLIGAGMFLIGIIAAWELAGRIAANDMETVIYAALAFAACVAGLVILRSWRTGFYMFFIWMVFEDLVRKYMGNNIFLFFGKDVLLLLIYVSFYVAVRKGHVKTFRPPFLIFLSLFFWLGILQMFNQNSPSFLYGLLGVKMYFYYVPLMWVGYGLIRNDKDLQKFLTVTVWLSGVVCLVGIMQSILGNGFLNPANLAPELQELGNLEKSTLSGQMFNLPDSVFVSSGRYTQFLSVAFIVLMGGVGYLLSDRKRGRKVMFGAIGLLGVAALLSGNRGSLMTILITAGLLSAGFFWGAPWSRQQARWVGKVVRRSVLVSGFSVMGIFLIFPQEAGSRLDYYTETLLPSGADYQLGFRAWNYPMQNLMQAFERPNWAIGNGIGTATLGTQYVQKLTGTPAPQISVEEGFGTLIVEMGIVAPFLWILWAGSLVYSSWNVIRNLRKTKYFPIGLAIGWYCFVLLFLWTYGSLVAYENYVCNIFLWLLVGILFRLPDLALEASFEAIKQRT